MFIIDWWNSLSTVSQIFYCMALPATLVLLIQTLMMFIGIGGESDGFGEDAMPDDLPETDLPDAGDGIFDGEGVPEDMDPGAFDGLRIFTVRGIIAFFVVFGWVGIALESASAPLYVTLPIALISGAAMMVLLAFLLRAVMRLRSDGNTDNRNAIGTAGKVQLTIPPSRTGEGKVHLMLQGSYVERNAVTDDEEAIPTGSEVVVVGVSGQTDLVVKRK